MVTIQGRQHGDFFHNKRNTEPFKRVTITLHYHRYDEDYEGWNLWVWLEGQAGKMIEFKENQPYGYSATFTMENPEGIHRVGFIIRKSTEENDWASKRFDDRFITRFDENGNAEAWLLQGMEKIYYDMNDVDVSPMIVSASMNDWHEIEVKTNLAFDWEHDNLAVNLEGAAMEQIIVTKDHEASDLSHKLLIRTKDRLSLHTPYRVAISHFGYCDVSYGDIVRTPEFDEEFAYYGELGALYTPEKTTFRVWAPSAFKAKLLLTAPDEKEPVVVAMDKGPRGTWEYTHTGDAHLTTYMYSVKIGREWREAVDPYARAVTINGEKGVVVDLTKTNPERWTADKPVFTQMEDAIIYELHVRDASIHDNSGIQNKGKFAGLAELNTQTKEGFSTGLSYIKELGVTHVQLLPVFDFWTVDETKLETPQYNWGYDPKHYNVPDGSYSSDPSDPIARIRELKQLIQAMHEQGLRTIMDVVYNHVYDVARSSFQQLVPGYYFRYTKEGFLSNGTGVGNDTASERAMMRKFMVDSLTYWAEEYHFDGFRFDLMGIHDVETMNMIRTELDAIDPSLIILGEGWDLLTPLADGEKANQKNAAKMPNVAHFNDSMRDFLKGNNFSDQDNGFVNGRPFTEHMMKQGISAGMKTSYDDRSFIAPNQVVNYVEAHDNHTLWDKLKLTNAGAPESDLKQMHKLATAIVTLSQGMTFLHAGQEFMRTKNGDHNSYRSSDKVNKLDWDRRMEFAQEVEYVKGLIQLRKKYRSWKMTSKEDINDFLHFFYSHDHVIAYQIDAKSNEDGVSEIIVLHNANSHAYRFDLDDDGPWKIVVNEHKAGTDVLSIVKGGSIEVPRYSTYVLIK